MNIFMAVLVVVLCAIIAWYHKRVDTLIKKGEQLSAYAEELIETITPDGAIRKGFYKAYTELQHTIRNYATSTRRR